MLRSSIGAFRLKLWDTDNRRLVPFRLDAPLETPFARSGDAPAN